MKTASNVGSVVFQDLTRLEATLDQVRSLQGRIFDELMRCLFTLIGRLQLMPPTTKVEDKAGVKQEPVRCRKKKINTILLIDY